MCDPLIETWEQVKRLTLADKERPYYQRRRHLLEQLAFWLHTQPLEGSGGQGRAREVAEGDLRTQIARFLRDDPQLNLDKRSAAQEAEAFITMIKARTGLLVERGESIYSFAHLTFQEYLVAAYLEYEHADSIDDLWAAIQPYLHHPAWREVILLLLGSLNKFRKHPTALVRRIFESTDQYEAVLHRHLFLAARTLADRVRVDADLHSEIVDKLLTIARSKELGQREAITVLSTLQGDAQAAAGLLDLSRDSRVAVLVRSAAAQALGQLGRADELILTGLLALAGDNTVNAEIRGDAAQALGWLGRADKVAAPLLALASDSRVDTWVRHNAAASLGQLGRADESAAVLLVIAGDSQMDAGVRRRAAELLGWLGRSNEAAEVLLILAGDNRVDAWVRSAAAHALGQLGRADEYILSSLLTLAEDSNVTALVRLDSAKSLRQLGRADEAAEVLLTLAGDSRIDAWLRCAAAESLGQLDWDREDILTRLLTLAGDSRVDALVRCDAAASLGQLGRADEAAEVLLTLACDRTEDAFVRSKAIQALGQLGRADEAVEVLLAFAGDSIENVGVRSAAAESLVHLGGSKFTVCSGDFSRLTCPKRLKSSLRSVGSFTPRCTRAGGPRQ